MTTPYDLIKEIRERLATQVRSWAKLPDAAVVSVRLGDLRWLYEREATSLLRPGEALKQLEPDGDDLRITMTSALKPCPFCGGHAIALNSFRPDTGIFRSVISCGRCMADVGANDVTREAARTGAVERWERRQ